MELNEGVCGGRERRKYEEKSKVSKIKDIDMKSF